MLFRLVRGYLARHRAWVAIILVFQLAQTLIGLSLPALNAKVIDEGIVAAAPGHIMRLGGLMMGAAALQLALAGVAALWSSKLSMGLGRELRHRVYHAVLAFSPTELARFGAGTLVTRTTNDVMQIPMVILFTLTMILSAPITGVGSAILVVTMDPLLALILIVAIPAVLGVVWVVMKRLVPLFELNQKRLDRLNQVIREQLSGVRVIRAFVRQASEARRFDAANRDLMATALSTGFWFAVLQPLMQIIIALAMAGVLYGGAHRIESGHLLIGQMTAFLSYLINVLAAIIMASLFLILLPRAEVAAKRVHEVVSTVPAVTSPDEPVSLPAGPLGLRVSEVEARYGEAARPVVSGVSFDLPPGGTLAVVGPTGAGKSSLARLLPRLIDPTAGTLTLYAGGVEVDVREADLTQIRSRIALIPQRPYLMRGTIATNVSCLPESAVTPEVEQRVRRCLEAACALDFVDAYDDGIAHEVASGGSNLSGGQRQRLTIARALYGAPDILVCDDAFSALDFSTEATVRRRIRELLPETSLVLIVQRLATIRHAEDILVLDAGRVAGRGRHETLMAECEVYRALVSTQLRAEELQ